MGPRAKGQTLNVFAAADDITNLNVEHDRDYRDNGPPRSRGSRDGGGADGGDWKSRGPRDGGGRRRDESDNPEIDEGNWRTAPRPPPQQSQSQSGPRGYGNYGSSGGYGGNSSYDRPGNFGSRENREGSFEFSRGGGGGASAAPPAAPTRFKVSSAFAGLVQSVNADTAPALAQAKKAAAAAAALSTPSSSNEPQSNTTGTGRATRFSALDDSNDRGLPPLRPNYPSEHKSSRYGNTNEGGGGFERRGPSSGMSFSRRLDDIGLKKMPGHTPDKMQRESEYALKQKREAAEQRSLMAKLRKEDEEAAERQREIEREREAAAAAKRELELEEQRLAALALERRAFEKKVFQGQLLVGSPADIRSLVAALGPIFEDDAATTAAEAMTAALTPELRASSLPLAIVFALYTRKVLDACEDAAEEVAELPAAEDSIEAAIKVDSVIKAVLEPVLDKYSKPCAALLSAFGAECSLEPEDAVLAKLQELARVVSSCGLGRLSPTIHLTELIYTALLRNEVVSREEFLGWFNHPRDTAEKRTDALARLVALSRSLRGLDVNEDDAAAAQEDENDSLDEEEL